LFKRFSLPRRHPVTRIEVVRPLAADPASLALLLAGPAATDQWPPQSVSMLAEPPLRSGVGFAAQLTFSQNGHRVGRGRLSITAAVSGDFGELTTSELRLVAVCEERVARGLGSDAENYCDNLVRLCEARSSAA
jgi:hypothetical protein